MLPGLLFFYHTVKSNSQSFSSTDVLGPLAEENDTRPFQTILGNIQDAPTIVKDFIQQKEDIVLIMAAKAEEAFQRRTQLVNECSCIPNRCSNVLGEDFVCGELFGNASKECDGKGTMYSMERGTSAMPLPDKFPGNLTDGLKASICLMNHLEKEAIPLLIAENISTWAYIGTEQGAIYSFPGRLRPRNSETGVEQWNFCEPYDPRTRPWYHEGATGPLDIVLVVDVSGSMGDLVIGSLSRWDIVKESLLKFLDTLTFTDAFNIVFFNDQGFSLTTGLQQGSKQNRDKAKKFIEDMQPGGGTDFEVAFNSAFDVLIAGQKNGNSTKCNKVILFLTDGKDNRVAESNRTRDILNKVWGLSFLLLCPCTPPKTISTSPELFLELLHTIFQWMILGKQLENKQIKL